MSQQQVPSQNNNNISSSSSSRNNLDIVTPRIPFPENFAGQSTTTFSTFQSETASDYTADTSTQANYLYPEQAVRRSGSTVSTLRNQPRTRSTQSTGSHNSLRTDRTQSTMSQSRRSQQQSQRSSGGMPAASINSSNVYGGASAPLNPANSGSPEMAASINPTRYIGGSQQSDAARGPGGNSVINSQRFIDQRASAQSAGTINASRVVDGRVSGASAGTINSDRFVDGRESEASARTINSNRVIDPTVSAASARTINSNRVVDDRMSAASARTINSNRVIDPTVSAASARTINSNRVVDDRMSAASARTINSNRVIDPAASQKSQHSAGVLSQHSQALSDYLNAMGDDTLNTDVRLSQRSGISAPSAAVSSSTVAPSAMAVRASNNTSILHRDGSFPDGDPDMMGNDHPHHDRYPEGHTDEPNLTTHRSVSQQAQQQDTQDRSSMPMTTSMIIPHDAHTATQYHGNQQELLPGADDTLDFDMSNIHAALDAGVIPDKRLFHDSHVEAHYTDSEPDEYPDLGKPGEDLESKKAEINWVVYLAGLAASSLVGTHYAYSAIRPELNSKTDNNSWLEAVETAYYVGFFGQYMGFIPGAIVDVAGPTVSMAYGSILVFSGFSLIATAIQYLNPWLLYIGIFCVGQGSKGIGFGAMLGAVKALPDSWCATISGSYLALDALSGLIFIAIYKNMFFQRESRFFGDSEADFFATAALGIGFLGLMYAGMYGVAWTDRSKELAALAAHEECICELIENHPDAQHKETVFHPHKQTSFGRQDSQRSGMHQRTSRVSRSSRVSRFSKASGVVSIGKSTRMSAVSNKSLPRMSRLSFSYFELFPTSLDIEAVLHPAMSIENDLLVSGFSEDLDFDTAAIDQGLFEEWDLEDEVKKQLLESQQSKTLGGAGKTYWVGVACMYAIMILGASQGLAFNSNIPHAYAARHLWTYGSKGFDHGEDNRIEVENPAAMIDVDKEDPLTGHISGKLREYIGQHFEKSVPHLMRVHLTKEGLEGLVSKQDIEDHDIWRLDRVDLINTKDDAYKLYMREGYGNSEKDPSLWENAWSALDAGGQGASSGGSFLCGGGGSKSPAGSALAVRDNTRNRLGRALQDSKKPGETIVHTFDFDFDLEITMTGKELMVYADKDYLVLDAITGKALTLSEHLANDGGGSDAELEKDKKTSEILPKDGDESMYPRMTKLAHDYIDENFVIVDFDLARLTTDHVNPKFKTLVKKLEQIGQVSFAVEQFIPTEETPKDELEKMAAAVNEKGEEKYCEITAYDAFSAQRSVIYSTGHIYGWPQSHAWKAANGKRKKWFKNCGDTRGEDSDESKPILEFLKGWKEHELLDPIFNRRINKLITKRYIVGVSLVTDRTTCQAGGGHDSYERNRRETSRGFFGRLFGSTPKNKKGEKIEVECIVFEFANGEKQYHDAVYFSEAELRYFYYSMSDTTKVAGPGGMATKLGMTFIIANATGRLTIGLLAEKTQQYIFGGVSFWIGVCLLVIHIVFLSLSVQGVFRSNSLLLAQACLGVAFGGVFTMMNLWMKANVERNKLGIVSGVALLLLALGTYFFGKVLGKGLSTSLFEDDVYHEKVGEHVYRRFFQIGAFMNLVSLVCCYVLWYSDKGDKIVNCILGNDLDDELGIGWQEGDIVEDRIYGDEDLEEHEQFRQRVGSEGDYIRDFGGGSVVEYRLGGAE